MAELLLRLITFFGRSSFRVRFPHIPSEPKVFKIPTWEELPIDITTLVNEAIQEDDPDCIKLENSTTLLHYVIGAVEDPKKRYELCKILLENGANINHYNRMGDTPFHYALELTDEELLKLLMSKGASVQKSNSELQRPLTQSVLGKNPLVAKYLLVNGADPNKCDWFARNTLLAECVINRQETIARLLLFHGANPNDDGAILIASLASELTMLQLLIDNGADLSRLSFGLFDKRTKNCQVGLIILLRNVETMEILLENGIDMQMDKYCILSVAYTFYEVLKLVEEETFGEFEKVMDAIVKHVVVLMVTGQGMQIQRTTNEIICKKSYLTNIFNSKLEQIELMRKTRVRDDFKVTYLDLMTRKGQKFVRSCNEDILETFEGSSEPEKLFPDFADKMKRNVDRGRYFKNALENFKQELYDILDDRLPFDLICCICDFLDVTDLRRFILHEALEYGMEDIASEHEKSSIDPIAWHEKLSDTKMIKLYGYSQVLCDRVLNNEDIF